MNRLKQILRCFYQALVDTIDHDGIEHAGYLAFLSLLSLFPFIVFLFALVSFIGQTEIGIVFAESIAQSQLIHPDIIKALEPRIAEIISGPPQQLLTIAIIGAIWTASSAVEGVRTVLNRAYRVYTPPAYIWRRLLSIGQMLLMTGIVITVIFLFIIMPKLWENAQTNISPSLLDHLMAFFATEETRTERWSSLRYIITSISLFSVISTVYYILPNIKQRLLTVVPGAIVVVMLWFLTGSIFSQYLSNFDQVHLIYGSLGGIIAALLFFYFCAMIFIYGAEFNYLLDRVLGLPVERKERREGR